MHEAKLAFIGAGNMAASLIGGLIADGRSPDSIIVTDPDEERRTLLAERFGIEALQDNRAAAARSAVIVLAVKPQVMHTVAAELAATVASRQALVVSIAAGIRTTTLGQWLGGDAAIVRCMPNTPALVQSGASALFANAAVSSTQRDLAESILRAAGLTVWIDHEDLMDAVTAVSGSGPAYFFLLIEALEQAGVSLGLPVRTARLLALQTAFGAGKMALESPDDAAVLRRRVTSPGGTTARAIETFEKHDFAGLVRQAVKAAALRSRELAEELGKL